MEIMGLIVIVVLLTLGMFFMLSLKSQPTQIRQAVNDDQIASNYLLSLLKITRCEHSIEELMQDCKINENDNDRIIMCQGENSCTIVNQTIDYTINKSLKRFGLDYSFEIKNMEGFKYENNCGSQRNRITNSQPIPLYPYPGSIAPTVQICR